MTRTSTWVPRAIGSVAAVAAGLWGTYGSVYLNGARNEHGVRVLTVFAVVWVAALQLPRWWRIPASLLALAASVALVPVIGGRSVVLAYVGVFTATAVLVEWRPVPSWPPRHRQVALLAVPPLLAGQLLQRHRVPDAAVVVALLAALAVVEAYHRRPRWVRPVDDRLVALWRRARVLEAAAFGWGAVSEAAAWCARQVGAGARWAVHRKDRRDRWFAGSLVVGFALRATWSWLHTISQLDVSTPYSGWNLRIAQQAARFGTPSFGGEHTAYWPPGYGFVLAPFAWLADHTTWVTVPAAAAALNVVLGTFTIFLCGALAQRWFGPSVRNAAAWLMALAPGHIYVTSVAVAEPLATTLFLGCVLGATIAMARPQVAEQRRALFALGIVIGFSVLVRDVSVTLLVVPALALRSTKGSFTGALRTIAITGAGALVVLAPWTVRNTVQVGWTSPMATIAPEGMCVTKYDLDVETFTTSSDPARFLGRKVLLDCYRNSLFDTDKEVMGYGPPPDLMKVDHPDEGRWARRVQAGYLRWAVSHPHILAKNVPLRIYGALGSDRTGGYDLATRFGAYPIGGPLAMDVYEDLATAWYYLVAGGSVLALLKLQAARRAAPVWFPVLVYACYTWIGPWSVSRHVYPSYAFMAILAGAAAMLLRDPDRPDEPTEAH